MNQQVKIGKFMQTCRKSKNLTQRDMAEQIGISDKTLSKWENGNSMPDITILPELCQLLDISVNELISGEYLTQEKYSSKAEENIMNLLKENKNSHSNIVIQLIMGSVLGIIGLLFLVINANFSWSDYLDIISLLEVILFTSVCTFFCRPQCFRRFLMQMDKIVLPVGGLVVLAQSANILSANDNLAIWICVFYALYPLLYAIIIHIILLIVIANLTKEDLQNSNMIN